LSSRRETRTVKRKIKVSTINIAETGRLKKIAKLPREISSDCLRELSINGPNTSASRKGAPSNPTLRSIRPRMPATKEFKKLTGDDPTPLTPEALATAIREIPRDRQIIELFKKLVSGEPLPPR
jgi:CRISPR/Cas system-associated endonuclease/helicase Cas3